MDAMRAHIRHNSIPVIYRTEIVPTFVGLLLKIPFSCLDHEPMDPLWELSSDATSPDDKIVIE